MVLLMLGGIEGGDRVGRDEGHLVQTVGLSLERRDWRALIGFRCPKLSGPLRTQVCGMERDTEP